VPTLLRGVDRPLRRLHPAGRLPALEAVRGGTPTLYFIRKGLVTQMATVENPLLFNDRCTITSTDGMRSSGMHWGVDFGSYGKNIDCLAVEEGTVIEAFTSSSAYGTYVTIQHPNGYCSRYGHLHSIVPGITAGTKVKAQQKIGLVGTTGMSTGEHLHFEILTRRGDQNSRIDSLPYATGKKKLKEEEEMTQAQFAAMVSALTPDQSNALLEKAMQYRAKQLGSEGIAKEYARACGFIGSNAPAMGIPSNEAVAVRALRIAGQVVAEAIDKLQKQLGLQ